MRLVSGRDAERRRVHLDEAAVSEEAAQRREHAVAAEEEGAAVGMAAAVPPGRMDRGAVQGERAERLAVFARISMVRADITPVARPRAAGAFAPSHTLKD
jgi:hypothetical protein